MSLSANAGDGWLGIEGSTAERRRVIGTLESEGILTAMTVEGINHLLYRLAGDTPILSSVTESVPPAPRAAVIAPLDNLIWDRDLIREFFGFDYVWEVYKPAAQRRWLTWN